MQKITWDGSGEIDFNFEVVAEKTSGYGLNDK